MHAYIVYNITVLQLLSVWKIYERKYVTTPRILCYLRVALEKI